MAKAGFNCVIYIIIRTTMETFSNIRTSSNNNFAKRFRSLLAIAGIVTAIVCALVLRNVGYTASGNPESVKSIEISKHINGGLVVRAASTLWSIR
jgi:hypothetical protein